VATCKAAAGLPNIDLQWLWNDVASRNYSLFGQFGARPEDTDQGNLGNRWLVGAAAAAAEHPGLIEGLFMTKSLNKAGVYAINLFYMGVSVTILIDYFHVDGC